MVAWTAVLAGCATVAPTPPFEWATVALPGDAAAVTLTAYRDELLVGTRPTDDTAAPGLVRLQGSTTTVLAVTPASGYGPEARWLSIAVDDGGDLVAVGGARGGAHANVRWTVWRGSTESGLREEEQTFDTFGGWGAGDLVGAVAAPSGPAVVGSWGSRAAGLDAAVWLPQGSRWIRQDPAGTALESTPDALVGPVAAAPDGSSVLIAGSLVRLATGSVTRAPAVWRSAGHVSQWSRVDLPDGGSSGEATGAVCRQGSCTVVGSVDDRVAVWRLGQSVERLRGLPDTAATDENPASAPVLTDDGVLLAASSSSGSTLLRERAGAWSSVPGPPGPVRALAVVGQMVYAVVPDGSGTDRLWRTSL